MVYRRKKLITSFADRPEACTSATRSCAPRGASSLKKASAGISPIRNRTPSGKIIISASIVVSLRLNTRSCGGPLSDVEQADRTSQTVAANKRWILRNLEYFMLKIEKIGNSRPSRLVRDTRSGRMKGRNRSCRSNSRTALPSAFAERIASLAHDKISPTRLTIRPRRN